MAPRRRRATNGHRPDRWPVSERELRAAARAGGLRAEFAAVAREAIDVAHRAIALLRRESSSEK